MQDHVTEVENEGLKNAGLSYRGVENARPAIMKRRGYKNSKKDEAFIAR